jgi:hypothetical protein
MPSASAPTDTARPTSQSLSAGSASARKGRSRRCSGKHDVLEDRSRHSVYRHAEFPRDAVRASDVANRAFCKAHGRVASRKSRSLGRPQTGALESRCRERYSPATSRSRRRFQCSPTTSTARKCAQKCAQLASKSRTNRGPAGRRSESDGGCPRGVHVAC